jgi:hypothetical protein
MHVKASKPKYIPKKEKIEPVGLLFQTGNPAS